jgi:hypothetical protein
VYDGVEYKLDAMDDKTLSKYYRADKQSWRMPPSGMWRRVDIV